MYKLYNSPYGQNFAIRISDGACIPFDPQNVDYQQYLVWVEAGNEPLPATEGAV